jgi:hypothetical protein
MHEVDQEIATIKELLESEIDREIAESDARKSASAIRLSKAIMTVTEEGRSLSLLSQTTSIALIRLLRKVTRLLGRLAADE